jgi:hypothetical protein
MVYPNCSWKFSLSVVIGDNTVTYLLFNTLILFRQ